MRIGITNISRFASKPGNAIFFLLAVAGSLFAAPPLISPREPGGGESVASVGTPPESPPTDVGGDVADDTTRAKAQLDTVVTYSADSVSFTFNPRITTLVGKARVAYREMELSAPKITVHWDEDLLIAESDSLSFQSVGVEERGTGNEERGTTAQGDSLLAPRSSSLPAIDKPRLVDGTQVVDGEQMVYNIKTRRGRVIQGITKYEDGYTRGSLIKKVDEGVLDIESGRYTTCDAAEPHYTFWSRDLKLIVKDKVIARPVVLCFGPVPVAIIPFAIFPARGGRHSGVIIPTYGESAGQGRYFRNLGYYLAPNDYMDARGSLDFYEKYGLLFRGDADYTRRYQFNGNLSGSLNNQRREGEPRGYDLVFNHRHNLSPSATLNISAQYVSSRSYRQDLSLNPLERMRQTIRSDATLNKNWTGTPYSGSVNVHYEEDLRSAEETRSIPRVSFSRNKSPLIAQPDGASADDARWFNLIYWNYRMQGENRRRVKVDRRMTTEIVQPAIYKSGVQHDISVNASQKPLKYFVFNPNFSYSEAWFDEWYNYSRGNDGGVDTVKQTGFRARRTFSAGAGFSTKLYGLFRPHLLHLEAVRHTLTPSLNFTYRPDFGDEKWGIYRQFADPTGRVTFYDRYLGAIYGSPGRGKSMSLGINLDNLFQYKILRNGKEAKGDLFSLNMGTSHNFAADSLKWSDLTSSVQVKPLGQAAGAVPMVSGLTLQLSGTHTFYRQVVNPVTGGRTKVNRPAAGGLDLVSFDLSTSFQLKSNRGGGRDTTSVGQERETPADRFDNPVWQPSPLPWEAGVSFHYGERRDAGDTRNIWAQVNWELQATRNWKVGYDTRIDLNSRKVVSSNITIYRDLHCWEGRFNWNPTGVGQGYYLIIAIKSPQLRDIKVEKQKGMGGFLGLY
jgi:hypothetical protein